MSAIGVLRVCASVAVGALAALAIGPGVAAAQAPALPDAPGGVAATGEPIETDPARRPDDAAIARRLRAVLEATEALAGLEVQVAEGVLTLSGNVADAEGAALARELGARTRGVVAVRDRMTLDTSVEGRLTPAAARGRALAREIVARLPLWGLALGIVVALWLVGVVLARQVWLWGRIGRNPLVAALLQRVAPLVFLILGVVVALNVLNAVAVLSAVLGAAGVVGIAVGFAVRDTIENFIASVMLSVRQPFRPKDLVEIDGQCGNVVRLTSRATILLTLDGNHLRIPNADVFKAVIVNYTRHPRRRFTFELGVDAADDLADALRVGLDALGHLDFVLREPAPNAWIERVGDSNVLLTFAPWIDQTHTDFLKARTVAITTVKAALEAVGFTLPEPIYRLRIDEAPPGFGGAGAEPRRAPPRPRPPPAAGAGGASLDTRPDRALDAQIEADRDANPGVDLLSESAPTEFGDDGRRG